MIATTPVADWQRWLARWEAQQGSYMRDREERFAVIIDTVQAVCGDEPCVVDLGSGPGSLSRRILERLPGARVTAIDMDPVLLAIGRNALGDHGGRLRWLDTDLRAEWTVADGWRPRAAVSTTALHWLQPRALSSLYRHLSTVLPPGGVFINGDRLDFPAGLPRLAGAARAIRERTLAHAGGGAESWEEWWSAVEREPALAAEVAERTRRHHDHPNHEHQADLATHAEALRAAGFAEVGTIWQHLADRVLVAIR